MKKFVVSFISALLLSFSFISVLPAFADDISTRLNDNNIADILQKNYKTLLSNRGYTDDYAIACYWYSGDYGDRGILYGYNFYLIDKSYIGKTISDDSVDYISAFSCDHLDTKSKLLSDTSGTTYGGGKFLPLLQYDLSHIPEKHFVFSNFSVENIFDANYPNAPFKSPVSAQFDFKSDLEFFCCLKDNVSLPCDNRVWIEVYDSAPAIEKLVYKPHKYVYTKTTTSSSPDIPNQYEQVIGDYLLANSVGPYYSISVDTLLHAGCSPDSFYTARAYVYNGSKPYEIANLTFKISSDGLSTVDTTLHDPDHPDDPIMKTWNNDNRSYVYNNVNTGEVVDKDKLVYEFDSNVDPSVNGSGQDISEFDFTSDFSTDLTQGAGLVRTLFDKIIQAMGLSGFMITVLSVAVVGWFIFGSRR